MKLTWPDREARQCLEIRGFIEAYYRLPHGRQLDIETKGDKPDYILEDVATGENVGVELTSVYLNERSVPDEHMQVVEGPVDIPFDRGALEQYKERLINAVKNKVQKARNEYGKAYPLILSVYLNEYVSMYLTPHDLSAFVKTNEAVFDEMAPFSEVVFWGLPNNDVLSVRPQ